MQELRWNPLLGTWTMVAANRQNRPHLPTTHNPFGPDNPHLPKYFRVFAYPNDFPALSHQSASPSPSPGGPYQTGLAYGTCEVILYSQDESAVLHQLPEAHLLELINLWCARSEALASDLKIKYVFVFENRGAEVGVTIHHPHGQLYAYPFVPQKLEVEHNNARKYWQERNKNLLDEMLKIEIQDGRRIVFQYGDWVGYLPHFTDYPYGLFLQTQLPVCYLHEMDAASRAHLAEALRAATATLDTLFSKPMPYMMCIHQAVVNSPEYGDPSDYFRLHIEFYPALRSQDRVKFYASSEMGAWAAANPCSVEETAEELRTAFRNWKTKSDTK